MTLPTLKILQTPEYKTLMQSHLLNTIEYLFSTNQEFSVSCQIAHTSFNPPLPHEIKETFQETALFVLSGYTFESASIDKEYFSFEAGFGSQNMGSVVMLPLLAIKGIYVEEYPIVLNFARYNKVEETPKIDIKSAKKSSLHSSSPSSSMEALLNNPENKKLLKKKK